MDQPARIRFQKFDFLPGFIPFSKKTVFFRYRGLKSFQNSDWDTKENLPREYARIFQFGNYKRTKKRILKEDEKDGALVRSIFASFINFH